MECKSCIKKRILLVGFLLFLTACEIPQTPKLNNPGDKKYCETNEDCMPASCCHPNDAVNKANALNCQGIMCTQECRPGTIDCNQGEVICKGKQCGVLLY